MLAVCEYSVVLLFVGRCDWLHLAVAECAAYELNFVLEVEQFALQVFELAVFEGDADAFLAVDLFELLVAVEFAVFEGNMLASVQVHGVIRAVMHV